MIAHPRPRVRDRPRDGSGGTAAAGHRHDQAAADVEFCSARIEACVLGLRRMSADCRTGLKRPPPTSVGEPVGEPARKAAHALVRQCADALGRVL